MKEIDKPDSEKPAFQTLADKIAEEQGTDVLFYNAPLERHLDQRVIELCNRRKRRKNVLLVLITEGGDADAAYRIARCLQLKYERFVLFVPGYCKSAGTLLCTGAHELVVSPDQGELGPLDVQLVRKDELFETQSGLTAAAALSTLNQKAFSAFEDFMLQVKIKARGAITTRMATEIASKLTCGLFAPIYQQIDPMHVGEAGRALEIAREYGLRLNAHSKNLKDDALDHLVSYYPSHHFIVDLAEAKRLFRSVREPNQAEAQLAGMFGASGRWPARGDDELVVSFLSSEVKGAEAGVAETEALKGERRDAGEEEPRSETESTAGVRDVAEAVGSRRAAVAEISGIGRHRRTP